MNFSKFIECRVEEPHKKGHRLVL